MHAPVEYLVIKTIIDFNNDLIMVVISLMYTHDSKFHSKVKNAVSYNNGLLINYIFAYNYSNAHSNGLQLYVSVCDCLQSKVLEV